MTAPASLPGCPDDAWALLLQAATAYAREYPRHDDGSASNPFLHAAEAAWRMAERPHPPSRDVPRGGFHVYFLWNGDDLMYVGSSTVLAYRLSRHRRYWRGKWDAATWEPFRDRESMLAREVQAIQDYAPSWNVQHRRVEA